MDCASSLGEDRPVRADVRVRLSRRQLRHGALLEGGAYPGEERRREVSSTPAWQLSGQYYKAVTVTSCVPPAGTVGGPPTKRRLHVGSGVPDRTRRLGHCFA